MVEAKLTKRRHRLERRRPRTACGMRRIPRSSPCHRPGYRLGAGLGLQGVQEGRL